MEKIIYCLKSLKIRNIQKLIFKTLLLLILITLSIFYKKIQQSPITALLENNNLRKLDYEDKEIKDTFGLIFVGLEMACYF